MKLINIWGNQLSHWTLLYMTLPVKHRHCARTWMPFSALNRRHSVVFGDVGVLHGTQKCLHFDRHLADLNIQLYWRYRLLKTMQFFFGLVRCKNPCLVLGSLWRRTGRGWNALLECLQIIKVQSWQWWNFNLQVVCVNGIVIWRWILHSILMVACAYARDRPLWHTLRIP